MIQTGLQLKWVYLGKLLLLYSSIIVTFIYIEYVIVIQSKLRNFVNIEKLN